MWQNTTSHLGHFLLEFFCQSWTQGTLRHILGPVLVMSLMIPWPFEYFSEKGPLRKSKFTWKQRAKTWSIGP